MLAANDNHRTDTANHDHFARYRVQPLGPLRAELIARLFLAPYRKHFKPVSSAVPAPAVLPLETEQLVLHGKPLTFEDIELDFYDLPEPVDYRRPPGDSEADIWKAIEEHLALQSRSGTALWQTRTIGEGKNDGG